jgi:hypothetical protein
MTRAIPASVCRSSGSSVRLPAKLTAASVSFTLDRCGHLSPEADTAVRDRLDALYVAGAQTEPLVVIELRRDASRPQRGPGTR